MLINFFHCPQELSPCREFRGFRTWLSKDGSCVGGESLPAPHIGFWSQPQTLFFGTPLSSPYLCLGVSLKQILPYSPSQTLSAQWQVLQSHPLHSWICFCGRNILGCQRPLPLGPSRPPGPTCALLILECLSCKKTGPEKVPQGKMMLLLELKCLAMTIIALIEEVLKAARRAIAWCFWGQAW